MHASFPLGRIAGTKVSAHWSLVVVVWLITWSLADTELPAISPGHSHVAYWLVGFATAALFFLCLLAHELSHSLVARRRGMQVDGIVLWLFGGVSQLHGDAPSAEIELEVAAAGPIMSIGLALVCLIVTRSLDATLHHSIISAGIGWLGWMNGLLAAFNLVPAFPLDGGRVLRAWLWRRRGDKDAATAAAARAGRIFGYLLIWLGALEFFAGEVLSGLWFVFLGWFLLVASTAEATRSLLEVELAGVKAGSVMTRDPIVAPAGLTIDRLIHGWLDCHRCSTFPLVDAEGIVVGLITVARIKRVPVAARASTLAAEVACPRDKIVTCEVDEGLLPVLTRMNASPDQRVLVYEAGKLVGIISPSDVTRALEVAHLTHPQPVS